MDSTWIALPILIDMTKMMKHRHSYRMFWRSLLAVAVLFVLGACSIAKYQGPEDVLYTGIKDIRITGDKRSAHAQNAIALAEAQLQYAPNNSLMGSSSLRLPLPLYRPWLYLTYSAEGSWLERWLHRRGKKPVWVRDVSPVLRARVAERLLAEQGYLGASVRSEVLPYGKDSLRARLAYEVDLGELYLIDSVEYLPRLYITPDHALDHARYSVLQRGKPFALATLSEDRTAVSNYLRENGYLYFSPEYVQYEADTLVTPGAVQLRTRLSDNISEDVLRQWRIGEVRVRMLDAENQTQSLGTESLQLSDGVVAHYSDELSICPRVLDQRIRLRPDSLYRAAQEDLTMRSLASIGTFTGLEVQYARRADTLAPDSAGIVDMTILMRRDKPWDVSLGTRFLRKSTDFIGPGLNASLSRRNLFGGGETFSISAAGSYEWQVGTNPFRDYSISLNSYYLTLDASLTFPTLLIPGRLNAYYDFPTTTTLKLSGQRMNRAGYYALNAITLSAGYDFTPRTGHTHSIVPLSFSYNQLSNTTEAFDRILVENPSLALSLASQLIPQTSYTYTWDTRRGEGKRHRLWTRLSLSEAGNLIKGGFMLLGGSKFSDTDQILGVPFAQFVKAYGEVRYTHALDRRQSLALRLGMGAIYSYGNMERAPYMEQFSIGGANSIRAFTIRSLGPGSFRSTSETAYTFMDHVGESKLEMNAEWRMKLTGSIEGAVFLDAGNIWLLRADPDRPGASLGEIGSLGRFLDQIAVGTGAGLRYDMGYLVVRFDVGLGLHLPYETERKGWYNIPTFSSGLGYHLAIGYPF